MLGRGWTVVCVNWDVRGLGVCETWERGGAVRRQTSALGIQADMSDRGWSCCSRRDRRETFTIKHREIYREGGCRSAPSPLRRTRPRQRETGRTSYRLFNTVNGFNTNPTLVRATAPATKLPWLFNFGKALVTRSPSCCCGPSEAPGSSATGNGIGSSSVTSAGSPLTGWVEIACIAIRVACSWTARSRAAAAAAVVLAERDVGGGGSGIGAVDDGGAAKYPVVESVYRISLSR